MTSSISRTLANGLLALLLISSSGAHAQTASSGIEITDPWARISPKGEAEVYFDILNHGEQSNSLVSATSPLAEKVILKHLRFKALNARAEDVQEIKVSAAGRTTLKPGQYYLVLDHVKGTVAPGSVVNLTLHFAHGEDVEVEARVSNQLLGNRGR